MLGRPVVSRTASTKSILALCCPQLGRLIIFLYPLTLVKHAVCYLDCLPRADILRLGGNNETANGFLKLTHLNPSDSSVRMVTLPPSKPITQRRATATSTLVFSNAETLRLIREASIEKGDVLSVSRIAGIMASKQTANLIPMCHNIPLSGTDVDIQLLEPDSAGLPHGAIEISVTVKTTGQTGVEMDALTGAAIAGLTAYDMCKAVDKGMTLTDVRVTHKEGGKSGTWDDGKQTEKGYGEQAG